MRESTTDAWIAAHDAAWDEFVSRWRPSTPPSKWDAFADGFAAGVAFGRANPAPSVETN